MRLKPVRTTRARNAALLLGLGLGAFFEGILLHPIAGLFYMLAWAVTLGGVLLLWSSVRGPGPLPSGRDFTGHLLVGWGIFNMIECLVRHDLAQDWLIFAAGAGFALVGVALALSRGEAMLERRAGYDRRSASPLR